MASQVTTAARKTVSFKSPYIGKTFQELTRDIFGRDGIISGGLTTDNGAVITVAPFKMVSRGIIGETLAESVVDVPVDVEPWYIVASLPDDTPESGIVVQVTRSLQQASTGVVIASKSGDVWRNSHPVDIAGASQRAAEPGPEAGFTGNYKNTGNVYSGTDGTTVVSEIFSNIGRVVTPEGVRLITDSVAGQSAKQLEITPRPAASSGRRTDRVVLRQRESFSTEIAYLLGGTLEGADLSATIGTGTSGVAPHYYAKRGGTDEEQWWAWGDGADLRVYGGIAGAGFGGQLLLSGTAITHVWIAGQRTSDDALILLYVDNGNLSMVAFSATAGTIVAPGAASIESLPNAINRVSGVLDSDGLVHIVFEYDDGAEQQAYYTKVSSVVASWAVVASAPNYVVGANSTFNDTKPQVKVCRNGIAHVVFIRGTGANEYGDLVYATMDSNGDPSGDTTYAAATDVAENLDQNLLDFSEGIAQVAYHSFTHISLVLTPHDELYVALGAGRVSQTPEFALLFSPELVARTGYPVVQIKDYTAQDGIAIVSDDAGEVIVVTGISEVGAIASSNIFLGTQPGAGGLADLVLGEGQEILTAGANLTDVFTAEIGPTGEIVRSFIAGTAINARRNQGTALGNTGDSAVLSARLHPDDLLLTSIDIDSDAVGVVEEQGIEIFQARLKSQNYPIVVGQQGDYLGHGSLRAAIQAISRDGGGTVVLRSGHHWVQDEVGVYRLDVPANVSLIGENGAVIEAYVSLGGSQLSSVTINGNVMEDNTVVGPGDAVAGAWVLLDTSGWHQIRKVLRPRESDGGLRVLLSDGFDGAAPATAGGLVYIAATGQRFENITVLGDLYANIARQCTIRNVTVKGAAQVFTATRCYQCIFENIDLTQALDSGSSAAVMTASSGDKNIYRNINLADTRGWLAIAVSEENPSLIDCRGDGANAGADVFDIATGRSTPVNIVNCEGRFSTPASQGESVTNVSELVRVPEGLGTISFEDDPTRAATGPIKLAGVAAAFDGATPQVIVDSVNERVKAAGDSMSGDLTMGANIPTDGTTRTIGAAGAAGNRFNAYANILDVLGAATLKDRTTLGQDLLGSIANADVARVAAAASVFAGVEYTLMWESVPSGQKGYRLYISSTGSVIETVNAKWDNAANTWSKDTGQTVATATRREMSHEKIVNSSQDAATNGWADAAWNSQAEQTLEGHTVADGVLKLGQSLIGAAADLQVPRIVTEHDSTVGERMLLWEMDNPNQPTTPHKIRLYRSNAIHESFEITFNCSWDNTANTWQWDNSAAYKSKITFSRYGLSFYMRFGGGSDNWTDTPDDPGGWDHTKFFNMELNLASVTVSDLRWKVVNTTGTNNPAYNANLTGNTLYAKSIVKAWANVTISSSGTVTVGDGYGWASIVRSGGRGVFTLKVAMANTGHCPLAEVNNIGGTTAFLGLTSTVINVGHYNAAGSFLTMDTTTAVIRIIVCGQQDT